MACTTGLVEVKHAMAAALSSVSSQPTSNIVTTKVSYEILFTTATTGTIKTVVITFPAFNVGPALLIETSGIGPGTLSVSGTTLTYTVTNPVSITKGTPIRLELANIIQPLFSSSFSISVTTKDSLGNTIDGPTAGSSSLVQIGNLAIANQAVSFSKISPGAVSVSVHQVEGAATSSPPNTEATAFATCPSGSVATGGGFTIQDGLQVERSALNSPSSTQWLVTVFNAGGATLNFNADVVCVTAHP